MKIFSNSFWTKNHVNKNKSGTEIKDFKSVEEFWNFIIKNEKWYLKFSPHTFENLKKDLEKLAPLIINATNDLRKEMLFSYDDYSKIMEWDNFLINENNNENSLFRFEAELNFKQYCPSCHKQMPLIQRYPKTLCKDCNALITDNQGRNVEFFNTEVMGNGCQGYFSGTNQTEKYDSDICYINGLEYFAEEARFGGIVIQRKE